MYCPKCGTENKDGVKFCAQCGNPVRAAAENTAVVVTETSASDGSSIGASLESHSTPQGSTITTINVQTPQVDKNPIGVAGFIFALVGVFVSWIPILGWIVWIIGAILCLVGLFKKPKGLAIAGLILTFIDLILLMFVVASCAAIGGGLAAMS